MRSILLPTELLCKKNVTDLMLDTTGLKVYGEGEWCAKKYGGKAKWLKLHIGMNLTVHDTVFLEGALHRCNRRRGRVLFDGIADSKGCYEICRKRNKELLTPPSRNAILRQEPEYGLRNKALRALKG